MKVNWKHMLAVSLASCLWAGSAAAACLTTEAEPNNTETGSYTVATAGTYFVRVKSYQGSGSYTLKVTLPGAPPVDPPNTSVVTGKVWLNGGLILQDNASIFVGGLRQATGKNTNTPNINSVTNCDTNWNTTPCPRVAIITAAAVNQANGIDKFTNDTASGAWSYYNLFQRHGFAPKHILSHHDTYASNSGNTSTTGQANIAIINQADLVYVIGGDQSRLARAFLNDDGSDRPLMAALRARYAAGNFIYAGDSAGTAIAPSTSYGEGISIGYLNQNTLRTITPAPSCLSHPSNIDFGTKIKGFGFVPNANIDTHFDNRASRSGRLGRLLAALKHIGPNVAYGIDQNTALYLNGDVGTVYGTGGVFVTEATASNFGSALNSSNIFAVDANGVGSSSATFTHMIDQTPTSSTGTAPSDSYNPLSFVLTFRRDAVTQGYKNATGSYAGPYTIVKALVDVN